eukprot:4654880-Prymnesium_polylepis.1
MSALAKGWSDDDEGAEEGEEEGEEEEGEEEDDEDEADEAEAAAELLSVQQSGACRGKPSPPAGAAARDGGDARALAPPPL